MYQIKMTRFGPYALSSLILCAVFPLWADVQVPPIFGDHMVFQQGLTLPVWGEADPGEQVTVTLGNQKQQTTTGSDGHWSLKLAPITTVGTYSFTVEGKNKLSFTDVLVGEVWLCSGQSNMEFKVSKVDHHEEEIPKAQYPQIRLFKEPRQDSDTPTKVLHGHWEVCSPQSIPEFSAVAYFFGRDLQQKIQQPIGLIEAAWGGTFIEAWMSHEGLTSDPDFQPIFDRFAEQLKAYPAAKAKYDKDLPELTKEHDAAVAKALATGGEPPSGPHPPVGPGDQATPSGIYNGFVYPLAPFAIRGLVWYQGEQNHQRGAQYHKLLPILIRDWRKLWNEGDFPLLVIQLPNLGKPAPQPGPSDWAEVREAQANAGDLPNTGVVVTIDLGGAKLHPTNKQDVGARVARYAEKLAYGLPVIPAGPVFKSLHREGATIHLDFDYADGLKTKDGGPLKGFAIAGNDQKFVWATGTIVGNSVVLQDNGLKDAVAVRYDWAQNPDGNLYNSEDLPTRPFRTDSFPLTSAGKN